MLGLVGGVPEGETPRVADSSAADAILLLLVCYSASSLQARSSASAHAAQTSVVATTLTRCGRVLTVPKPLWQARPRIRQVHAALSERRETAEHLIAPDDEAESQMQFVTPTKAADPLDGLPPPPRSSRPEPKWLAWPPSKLPQRPNTFTALKGSSGLVICVGLNKDGSYVAFDGNCYHMGEPLFDGCGTGDIEDDGSVRCPAHGRRVCATTGACADRGPFAQRTYRTRVRQTAEGVAVDVDVSRPGSFASDAYNGGCPSSVERRRGACAAIERVTPDRHVRRRLAYDDDEEEMAT